MESLPPRRKPRRTVLRAVFGFPKSIHDRQSIQLSKAIFVSSPRGAVHLRRCAPPKSSTVEHSYRRYSSPLFLQDCSGRHRGSGHPHADFDGHTQQRNSLTNRQNIRCCGSHDKKRYTNLRPVRTNWHGGRTKACTNVLNSRPSSQRSSSRCRSCQRPGASGNCNANHAFRFQANAVITMYAQLLSNVSTGAWKLRRSSMSCKQVRSHSPL
jgi:hypothetical protein